MFTMFSFPGRTITGKLPESWIGTQLELELVQKIQCCGTETLSTHDVNVGFKVERS
jgi:hypothetical protein